MLDGMNLELEAAIGGLAGELGDDEARGHEDGDEVQHGGQHQHARHAFAEWIEIAVAHPSAGQQIVVEKHRRKGFDVLQFLQRQQAHGDGDELRQQFEGEYGAEGEPADRQAYGQCQRDNCKKESEE